MKYFLRFGILILLFISFFFYIYSLIEPAPIKEVSIATGRESGVYYQYAERYKKRLESEGITVNIIKTAGSIETLKLLREKEVDFGFVQSGTASVEDKQELKSVASLYVEPLWLFYRASLGTLEYFDDLNKTQFSMGEPGSGTLALTQKLLEKTNLNTHNLNIVDLDLKSSYQAFKENRLDAFFTVLSPKSEEIKEIFQDKRLSVLNLKRATAFTEHFPFLQEYKIYEGSMDLRKNIPSSNITLLATTATLVTHNDVDNSLVRLMTIILKENSSKEEVFPSQKFLEIPIHKASKKYLLHGNSFLEKIFPYWIASNIDRLKYLLIPLLTLLLPLFKSMVPIYRWRSRAKVYKWYKELDKISENWEQFDEKQLREAQRALDVLSSEIRSKTDVPLSFKWEYHTLQEHIDNVKKRIRERSFNTL